MSPRRLGAALLTLLTFARPCCAEESAHPREESNWLAVSKGPGANGCLGSDELRAAVRTRLVTVGSPAESGLLVQVDWAALADEGFRAIIELREGEKPVGARTLTSRQATCDELGQAVAIAVALAVDMRLSLTQAASVPEAPVARTEAPKASPAPAPVASSGLERAPTRPSSEPPPEMKRAIALRGGAAMAVGLLPELALGPSIGGVLHPWRRVSFDLSASLFPFEVVTPLRSGRGQVSYQAGLTTALACAALADAPSVALFACGGLSVGAIRYVPSGEIQGSGAGLRVVANPTSSLLSKLRLGGAWAAVLSLGLAVPLVRQRFVYSDTSGTQVELFKMPSVFGVFELGLEYELTNRTKAPTKGRARDHTRTESWQ